MKRALREAYDRELALLKERAAEFAAEHPGLADRLGGLLEENLDPTVAGLLEGSAFLAARVQVKMQDEFHTFTRELLDQLFPESLLPTPSVLLAQARLPEGNDALDAGLRFKPGDAIDAEFVDADSRVACRFTLASPLELWPLKISDARYLSRPGQVGALGQEIADGTKAGLVIDFERVITDDKTAAQKSIADIALDRLSLHLGGTLSEGTALYEQLLFRRLRVSLSWLDRQGDRVFRRLPPDCVTGIGFGRDERLFNRRRQFSGFSLLREFFIFPRKFLGFHIDGLRSHLSGINSASFQIVFEFDSLDEQLSERFEPKDVILHAVPAINLFNEVSSNVKLDRKQHEYIVTPNSSPITNFEFHDLTEVWAFYSGEKSKVPVWPLYALPKIGQDPRKALFYSVRRKPRRLTLHERRRGLSRNRYRGTETFITLYEPPGEARVQRLQVRGLCSNRHLAEHLPVNQGSGDFTMSTDQSVMLNCIAGPTPPRDSLADMEVLARHRTETGHTLWRLISYLSLSRFGFDGPDPVANAAALREVLWLFADLSQLSIEAQINALTKVTTRPVTRTIAMADGYHAARGLEVTLLFDEAGTESSGIALLGAVIERFLAEYTTINSFTQTILTSVQRGQITRFPPRAGHGPLL